MAVLHATSNEELSALSNLTITSNSSEELEQGLENLLLRKQ